MADDSRPDTSGGDEDFTCYWCGHHRRYYVSAFGRHFCIKCDRTPPLFSPDECRHCGRTITPHEGIEGVLWRDNSQHLSAGCPKSRSRAHEPTTSPGLGRSE